MTTGPEPAVTSTDQFIGIWKGNSRAVPLFLILRHKHSLHSKLHKAVCAQSDQMAKPAERHTFKIECPKDFER